MAGVIITGALCAVFIVLSAILLSGHGAGLIAGYNTAKAEEKAKYDEKKLCRATGVFTLLCAVMLGVLCCGEYFVEAGKISEIYLLWFAIIFIVLLIAEIAVLMYFLNVKCKK